MQFGHNYRKNRNKVLRQLFEFKSCMRLTWMYPFLSGGGGEQDTGKQVGRAPPHSPSALQVLLFSPRIRKPLSQLYATTAPKL